MKAYKLSLSVLSFMASAMTINAQDIITLDAYREDVMEYSQQLKQAKENVISAESKRKADRTGFLPRIDVLANGSLDLTDLSPINPGVPGVYHPYTYFAGGVLTQNIWAGGSDQARYRASKTDEAISMEAEELTIDNIYLQAETAYWTLSAQYEIMQVAKKYLMLITEQYNIIKLRFDDGAIAKNDLLMITTRLKEAELSMKRAEASYLIATQNFNILMGLAPNSALDMVTPIQVATVAPEHITFEEALENRPEYKTAELQINLLEQNRKLSISQFNPQFYFQLQGGWGTANPNLGLDPAGTLISSINFSMPLVRWNQRRNTNRQFKALVNSGIYNKQIVSDRINKEVANAWTNMDQSYTQITVAEETFSIAQESLDLNTFSYNEGRINISDLLSAQISWLDAYMSTINSHYSYKVAVAQYKRAVGEI